MSLRVWSLAAATAVSLVLTGCSGPEPGAAPPPPPPEAAYDRAPVELAGAPTPAPDLSGLAGGAPNAESVPAATTMAPIPDPEDLPPAERHRIYGTAYDSDLDRPRAGRAPDHAAPLPHADTPLAAASSAPPPVSDRPAPVRAAPSRPAAAVAKAPTAAKPAPPSTAAKPLDPRLAKLQIAVAPEISAGAALTLAAPLGPNVEGPVTLTLPPTLLDLIRQEAAKVGLGRAARTSEVSATLSGQGYEITPNGPQTARLKSGEAASFQWQVKPGADELGPLRAQIDAVLRGRTPPMTFPLGTITKAAPIPDTAPARFDLRRLNLGYADVPGVGRLRGETLVGGGLLLLALVLLVIIARNASEAEARARRRLQARKAAEEARTDPEPVPESAKSSRRAKAGDDKTAVEQKPDEL